MQENRKAECRGYEVGEVQLYALAVRMFVFTPLESSDISFLNVGEMETIPHGTLSKTSFISTAEDSSSLMVYLASLCHT